VGEWKVKIPLSNLNSYLLFSDTSNLHFKLLNFLNFLNRLDLFCIARKSERFRGRGSAAKNFADLELCMGINGLQKTLGFLVFFDFDGFEPVEELKRRGGLQARRLSGWCG
jgi:hypothetical protein